MKREFDKGVTELTEALPTRATAGLEEYSASATRASAQRPCRVRTAAWVNMGARHELLNETNRDEVQRDLLAWLAKTV